MNSNRSFVKSFAAFAALPVLGFFSSLSADTITSSTSDSGVTSTGSLYDTTNYAVRVGEVFGNGGSLVLPFLLPTLSAGQVFSGASLQMQLFSKVGTVSSIDLYGLTARSTDTVIAGDYYSGAAAAPSGTLIQTAFVTSATPVRVDPNTGFVTTTIGGGSALTAYLNAQYANGANAGKYVFLRLSYADTPPTDNTAFEFLTQEAGGANEKPTLTFTAVAAPVPEPSTYALFGGAAVGLVVMARRMKRRAV